MRILIDASTIREYRSGFGRYVCQLVKGLDTLSQHDVFLVISKNSNWHEFLDLKRVRSLPITVAHRLGLFGAYVNRTLRRMATKVDIWHSPVSAPPLGIRAKTVITVHDLAFYYYPNAYTKAALVYWKHIFKASLKKATMVIAVSENTRQDVIRFFDLPPSKVVTVYNALPCFPAAVSLSSQEEAFLRNLPKPYILYVGALNPRKNVSVLIEAYSILRREERISHKLILCGASRWNEIDVSTMLQKYGLANDVVIAGAIHDRLLSYIYKKADLFVYPSLYEGFGYPPLEALAHGVPVIASSAPPLPEILGDAACYFDPHSPTELAECMLTLLSDASLRTSFREKGYKRASLFTVNQMIKGTLEVYRRAHEN